MPLGTEVGLAGPGDILLDGDQLEATEMGRAVADFSAYFERSRISCCWALQMVVRYTSTDIMFRL